MKTFRAAEILLKTSRWRIDGDPKPFMREGEVEEVTKHAQAMTRETNSIVSFNDALRDMATTK